jgi:hypothetical protein
MMRIKKTEYRHAVPIIIEIDSASPYYGSDSGSSPE